MAIYIVIYVDALRISPIYFIYLHIPLYTYIYILVYTFIYLHIHPNIFICFNIPPYTSKYPIIGKLRLTKSPQIVITQVLEHPPRSKFNQNDPTISPDVFACPKGIKNN